MEDDQLLKFEDLERLLKVSRAQVYNLIAEGKIPPGFNIGRSRRWFQKEVMDSLRDLATTKN